jgi:5-methylcytosine-specific restriction endonuclease McrA
LLERVNRRYTAPRFRKWVLFNRDDWQCQYCGVDLDPKTITIDHVVPRSRGGGTSWKNCVSSCKKCNWKKGSQLLSETGMQLKKKPAEPSVVHFWVPETRVAWHPDWSTFFGEDR